MNAKRASRSYFLRLYFSTSELMPGDIDFHTVLGSAIASKVGIATYHLEINHIAAFTMLKYLDWIQIRFQYLRKLHT